jgi:crotonobetainyl-CoA:carnitine CoA-transferase CaiB-like acyl-CoA transferase
MSHVLHKIRVLDFGRFIAGSFCAALLAVFGVDVIRVDQVGGSEDRFVMPVTEGGEGAFFLQVNRNKRPITLHLDSQEGARSCAVSFSLPTPWRPTSKKYAVVARCERKAVTLSH